VNYFSTALWIFAFLGCQSIPHAAANQTLEDVIARELGPGATVEKNQSGTLALAYVEKERNLTYLVVRVADGQMIVKNKIRGSVTWHADQVLKETSVPGIIKADEKATDHTKLIDLSVYKIHQH